MGKKLVKKQINSVSVISNSFMLEQDEYLDTDLSHIRQYAELLQEEQCHANYKTPEDDVELN